MKILNREQIREADSYTINHEPIKSIDLMERAATKFFSEFVKLVNSNETIHIFCGKGNNGGDGLVVARLLSAKSFKVKTYIVHYSEKSSMDFDINLERLKDLNIDVARIKDITGFPNIQAGDILIDALWGTGLTKPIEGFPAEIIKKINNLDVKIFALDIASGTYCDSFNADENKIQADYTFSFQPPKLSFFVPENQKYIGKWNFLDIGLDKNFIENQETPFHFDHPKVIEKLFRKRKDFDHKGNFGHALLMAGSYGKIGASILTSKACLVCGAGLVTAYVPKCGYRILQTAIPEIMVMTDQEKKIISQIPDVNSFDAIGIGPGIGTHQRTAFALEKLFSNYSKPIVIDADGINILSQNENLLKLLPNNSILTPHIGEFERLVGRCKNHFERLDKLREFALKNKIIVVLKGKYSAVCNSDGNVNFNPSGNPGMATAGSGDVLTGIITSLLAQKYPPIDAANLGVYIHGLSGDLMAAKLSMQSLIASDLISGLSLAFNQLEKQT